MKILDNSTLPSEGGTSRHLLCPVPLPSHVPLSGSASVELEPGEVVVLPLTWRCGQTSPHHNTRDPSCCWFSSYQSQYPDAKGKVFWHQVEKEPTNYNCCGSLSLCVKKNEPTLKPDICCCQVKDCGGKCASYKSVFARGLVHGFETPKHCSSCGLVNGSIPCNNQVNEQGSRAVDNKVTNHQQSYEGSGVVQCLQYQQINNKQARTGKQSSTERKPHTQTVFHSKYFPLLKLSITNHKVSVPLLRIPVRNQTSNSQSSYEVPQLRTSPLSTSLALPRTKELPVTQAQQFLPPDYKLLALPLLRLPHQVARPPSLNPGHFLGSTEKSRNYSRRRVRNASRLSREYISQRPDISQSRESNVGGERRWKDLNGNDLQPVGGQKGLNVGSQSEEFGGRGSMEELEVVGEVGRGSYGTVWLVRHRGTSRPRLVLKCVELKGCGRREVEGARQEVAILASLRHPNIVSYKGSFESDGRLHLLLGYCEGGDLHTRISLQCGSPFPETRVARWFIQVTMALQYLHSHNILHRDLKTHNVLLTRTGLIKVGDFGISRVLSSPRDLATTLVGTPYYMSPELLAGRPYNHKSDVWALGCVLFELATLRAPFPAQDLPTLIYRVSRGKVGLLPSQYSDELRALVASLLSNHPDHRPAASQVLQLPYVRKHMSLFLQDTAGQANRGREETQQGDEENEGVWDGLKERGGIERVNKDWQRECVQKRWEDELEKREKEVQNGKKEEWEKNEDVQKGQRRRKPFSNDMRTKNVVLEEVDPRKSEVNEGDSVVPLSDNVDVGLDGASSDRVCYREVQPAPEKFRSIDPILEKDREEEEGQKHKKTKKKNSSRRCCEFLPGEFESLHISGGRMRLGERSRVEQPRPSGEKECRCPRNRHHSAGHVGSLSRIRRRSSKEKIGGDMGREIISEVNKSGGDNAFTPHLSSSARERRRHKRVMESKSRENRILGSSAECTQEMDSLSDDGRSSICQGEEGEEEEEEEEEEYFVDLLDTTLKDTGPGQEEEMEEEVKEVEEEVKEVEEEMPEEWTLEAKISRLEETLVREVGQKRARSVMDVLRGGEEEEEQQEEEEEEEETESIEGEEEENYQREDGVNEGEGQINEVEEQQTRQEEEEEEEEEDGKRGGGEDKVIHTVLEEGLSLQATNAAWHLALCYSLRQGSAK